MAEKMKDGIRRVVNSRKTQAKGRPAYSYKVPYRNAAGVQTSATFDTLKAAEQFRDKLRDQRNLGLVRDPKAGRISVYDYGRQWLTTKETTKRDNTVRAYRTHLEQRVFPELGGLPMCGVAPAHIQALVNDAATTLAPRTVHGLYKMVSALFRSAVIGGVLPESPCVGIERPELPDDPVTPLDTDEVAALAAAMPGRFQALVILAAGTGLRLSECLGLTWDRIDWQAGTVTVDRQFSRSGFAPVKSRTSRRVVPLPETVLMALVAHEYDYPPETSTVAVKGGESVPARLVFTSERRMGGELRPVDRGVLRRYWCAARTAASVDDDVTFHQLRHFYASVLIDAGESPKIIQQRLGHSSISVTMDTYGHLYPHSKERTRDVLDSALASVTVLHTSSQRPTTSQKKAA